MQSGANPAAVQRILRHSDPRITTEVYGHLAPGYLRAEVDRLKFGLTVESEPAQAKFQEVAQAIACGGVLDSVLDQTVEREEKGRESLVKNAGTPGPSDGAGNGIRTRDPQLGKLRKGFRASSNTRNLWGPKARQKLEKTGSAGWILVRSLSDFVTHTHRP